MLTAASTSRGAPVEPESPVDRGELVDQVTGLLAEEAGQVDLILAEEMEAHPGERSATARVWLTFEMQTRKLGGSMLHCVTNPARQPLISASGDRTVTTKYG